MTRQNYYVGVLLAASRNPLNKIQFFARQKRDGRISLFARTEHFSSKPDLKKMKHIGDYHSLQDAVLAVNSGKTEMKARGLTVPGVTMFAVE